MQTKNLCVLIHIRIKGEVGTMIFFPFQGGASFVDLICSLSLLYCHVCSLQPCGHLLGKTDLLAPLYMMISCVFVTFTYSVLGQVWYLIVSIPDLCFRTYFYKRLMSEVVHIFLYRNSIDLCSDITKGKMPRSDNQPCEWWCPS